MTAAIIGIDVGTTGVKVIAVDVDTTRCLASRSAEYRSSSPVRGAHEQNPDDWWRTVGELTRELLAEVPASRVAAVGLSGHMHSLLLLDDADRPIRAAMTWADRRAGIDTARLVAEPQFLAVGGNSVVDAFTAPKLAWLARTDPALLARARRLVLAKDFIKLQLTGVWSTDETDAAGTLLYDVRQHEWSETLWALTGASPLIAPPVSASTVVSGTVTAHAAALTGLREGTPVVCGAGDVSAAVVGTGVVRPDQICINAGTAAQVMALTAKPDAGSGFLFGSPLGEGFIAMASLYAAGASIRWAEGALLDGGSINDAAAASVPGARGLTYLPFMFGSAVPVRNDAARAAFLGQDESHGRTDLARAVLEAVAYGCADAVNAVVALTGATAELRVVGGVTESRFWCEIMASVLDMPLVRAPGGGSVMGAAVLAGVGVGAWPDAASAVSALATEPQAKPALAEQRAYRSGFARYQDASRRLLAV